MNEFSEQRENVAETLPQIIVERAKELGPEMEKLYADFHENPELGGEERETSKKVVSFLKSIGVEVVGEKIGLGKKDKEMEKRIRRNWRGWNYKRERGWSNHCVARRYGCFAYSRK